MSKQKAEFIQVIPAVQGTCFGLRDGDKFTTLTVHAWGVHPDGSASALVQDPQCPGLIPFDVYIALHMAQCEFIGWRTP